jgi:PAS domain S-box-containing protein
LSAARPTDRPADPAPEERFAPGPSPDSEIAADNPRAPRLSLTGILLLFPGIGLEILSQIFSGIYPSGQIADRLASAGAGLFFSISAILMVRRVTRRRSVLSAMILVASLFLFSKLLEVTGHVALFREIPLLGGGHWLHKDLHSAAFSLSMLLLLLTLFWMTYEAHRAEYLLKRSRQDALRLSESRYRLLAENATDVIWSCDNTLRLTYVSPSMRRMFGWDPGMLIGKKVSDLLDEEDRDHAAALGSMIELASGGGDPPPCRIEAHHLTPDGPPVWAEIEASVARNEKGEPHGLTGSARDITRRKNDEAALRRAHEETEDRVRRRTAELRLEIEERRMAEAALRAAQDRLTLATRAAAIGLWEYHPAEDRLVTNDRCADILGYLPEEMPASMTSLQELIHEEDRDRARAGLRAHLAGRSAFFESEYRMHHRDGGTVWILTMGRVVERGSDDTALRVAGVNLDITRRKETERARAESEETARALLDATSDIACLLGTDSRILACNTNLAKAFKRPLSELTGARIDDLMPPQLLMTRRAHADAVLAFGIPARFEDHWNGRWYEHSIHPVFNESGKVTRLAVYTRNVTAKHAASERLLLQDTALNAAGNAVVICDGAGRVTWANPAFTALTGYTRDEVRGSDLGLLKSGLQDQAFYEDMWTAIRAGRVWRGELVNRRRDGSLYHENMTIAPVVSDRGEPTHFIAIKQDISGRIRSEQALLRRDAILEAVGFAAAVFLRNPQWREHIGEVLARLGRAAEADRVYVFENETLHSGKRVTSQRHEWTAPGIRPQIDNPGLQQFSFSDTGFGEWEEQLGRGEPVGGSVASFSEDQRAVLDAQGIRSLVIVPVMVSGSWWGMIGFDACHQVFEWTATETGALQAAASILGASVQRMETEAALRESEELFRMVFENAAEAVFWADAATGVLLLCNRAAEELTGLPRAEIVGRHQAFLHPAEERELYRAMFERHREEDSSPFDEGEIVTASGDRRAVQITHSAAEVRGRRIVQGVFRDITSRREAERIITEQQMQMISASRMSALGVMASGIAHEINNPLAVISMAAEQLAGHAAGGTCPPEVLERLAPMLGRNVDRIERIVRGLRNLSREGARDPFARTRFGALVEDALELCRTRFMTHGIHLTVAATSDSLAVECRVTQISQVLLNLLNNAHDALDGQEEKWIRIEIEDEGDTVALAVCDSGPGVPDDLRERIMEPFFTTKEVGRGTGLGLSISKSIIEDHGGALLLDTTADCTRFVARLPKRQPR